MAIIKYTVPGISSPEFPLSPEFPGPRNFDRISIGGKTRGTGQADVNMSFDRNHDEFGGMMRDGNVQTAIQAFEAQESNPAPCQRTDLSESC